MIGVIQITLTNGSVREALEEYVNRHLLESAQVKVKEWTAMKNGTYEFEVELKAEPVGKDERPTPFPLDPVHD